MGWPLGSGRAWSSGETADGATIPATSLAGVDAVSGCGASCGGRSEPRLEALRRAASSQDRAARPNPVPDVIRRKFTITDPGGLLKQPVEFALPFHSQLRTTLKTKYGATDQEVEVLNGWAQSPDAIAGSPFPDWPEAIKAARAVPQPQLPSLQITQAQPTMSPSAKQSGSPQVASGQSGSPQSLSAKSPTFTPSLSAKSQTFTPSLSAKSQTFTPSSYSQPYPQVYPNPYSSGYPQPHPQAYPNPYSSGYSQPYAQPYSPSYSPAFQSMQPQISSALLVGSAQVKLVQLMGPGSDHSTKLQSSGAKVVETASGIFEINGQVEGAATYFAEMKPEDFDDLLKITSTLQSGGQLGALGKKLNAMQGSKLYRMRVKPALDNALVHVKSLGIDVMKPPFANMTLGEKVRLYDILNGAQYEAALKVPDAERTAAQHAMQSAPQNVFEFVTRFSFFLQAVSHLGLVEPAQTAQPGMSATNIGTVGTGPLQLAQGADAKVTEALKEVKLITEKAGIVKLAKLNLSKCQAPQLGEANVAELIAQLKVAAKTGTLGFGSAESAADHVLKHLKLGASSKGGQDLTAAAQEYLTEAVNAILDASATEITSMLTQDAAARSFRFEGSGGGHAIVLVMANGMARIATYVSPERK